MVDQFGHDGAAVFAPGATCAVVAKELDEVLIQVEMHPYALFAFTADKTDFFSSEVVGHQPTANILNDAALGFGEHHTRSHDPLGIQFEPPVLQVLA